jgi:hypothetical protein
MSSARFVKSPATFSRTYRETVRYFALRKTEVVFLCQRNTTLTLKVHKHEIVLDFWPKSKHMTLVHIRKFFEPFFRFLPEFRCSNIFAET